jgi:hypothetical protein
MISANCRRLFSLIAPLALGCGAPALSPDGGGALNGDAGGSVDVSSNVGSVMLNAVPPCGAGTAPSSLLTVDHSQPFTPGVYSTSGFANALLVDETGIYIDASFIVRAPLEGGRARALWTMQAAVGSFAIVDSVLWAAADWGVSGLLGLPIEGTAPLFTAPYGGIQNVAGAGKSIFFTGNQTPNHNEVESYGSDLASGPTIGLTGLGTLIAISGSDVFIVTTTASPATMSVETRLERGNTSGGVSIVLATSANNILSVAANSASVYWVEDAVGGAPRIVHRAAHDGSNEEIVANMNVSSLAVDEGAVYFAVDDGTIVETAADTLTPTVLAQGQVRPSAITQYGPRVYWINDRDDSSASMPKANAVMTACK